MIFDMTTLREYLLLCGVVSSALYVATVFIAPLLWWNDYSAASQTISELAAIGAPTAAVVVPLFTAYSILVCAFGIGVWRSAEQEPALRLAATGLFIKEVIGPVVTLFVPMQMHLREVIAAGGSTSSDVMHVVVTSVGLLFMLLALISGSFAFGKTFRLYSFATILLFLVGGALTFTDVPRMKANLPTPYMGVRERVCVFAYMLWVATLSVTLLRTAKEHGPAVGSTARPSP